MKTLQLLIVLILLSTYCNSQYLVQEKKMWSNTYIGSEVGSKRESYWIKFQGDTIFNTIHYKKILRSDDYNHNNWYVEHLGGFIREDSTKKVFRYYPGANLEVLWYDFNLEEKDTFFLEYNSYRIVDSVVYEPFGNSEDTVKQIHFQGENTIWIEGIGSTLGVLELFVPTGAYLNLTCYFENDELIYHNPQFEECYYITSVNLIKQQEHLIKIFSGQNGSVVVSSDGGKQIEGELQFFSTEGKFLSAEQLSGTGSTEICPPVNGFLIYRFTSKNSRVQHGKIFVP